VELYHDLRYPDPLGDRPYTVINMVATIDGKIITGKRGEPVHDLGSDVDHAAMRTIQNSVDAIMIGAQNQRSSPKIWYPKDKVRIVATRSGNVLYPSRFFDDAPRMAIVLCPIAATLPDLPDDVKVLRFEGDSLDWKIVMWQLATVENISTLLVEGGSEINAQILELDLVDELFLTVAPKIKLGAETPTYADGNALPRERVQNYSLIESHVVGDEIFLRYRRRL